ncbi:ATP-binding protein [Telmatobacter sp. DSM 110680]|uniref:histidine kinase n=1 Tax=Telmatobacter sp. DSM 110680 TaxID=3036704 RepID=A0AAU7DKC0_9BACT
MSLRQKLLLLFSLTVAAAVAAVAWTVLVRIRQVFETRDQEETALFVSQFQREFQHRSADVAAAVDRVAAQERVRNMAFELVQSNDAAPYLNEAQTLAQDAQLDFLEIVGPDGNIVSSAQWPARFGYAEAAAREAAQTPFLKREELADGSSVLGLFAVRAIRGAEPAVKLVAGRRLDQGFLADLPVAPGMQVGLYSIAVDSDNVLAKGFDPKRLVSANGDMAEAPRYASLIDRARNGGQQLSGVLYLTSRREDSVTATAIPLKNSAGEVLAVLTVAISRGGLVAEQQQIRAIAYGVASGGILLAIIFSLWIAARVSRPVEELARAAEEVASGSWDTQVPVRGRDEVAVLARSFNHMTGELSNQRERLVQSERVAAWRELARRLAHELKNPLFPLQLTVENLVRARQLPEAEFDEVFNESTQTLGMEIGNLKKIIGRFSDFSKMPKPELEHIDAREVVERVRALYAVAGEDGPRITVKTEVDDRPMPLMVDPDLLHRALSNLVLNAKDAMPEGGTVTISAHAKGEQVELRVADTGQGLTQEECERLFTPYYTTKQHGTGLGLAIVQSVVADHAGTITVESRNGRGATFVITLPRDEG